ncbi:MAG: glycosyltransferase family 2 protein [bacterium]
MLQNRSRLHRFYEILPGALIWATFILVIFLSFSKPIWAIIFIIAFDFYWLIKVLYTLIWLLIGWKKYRKEIKIDWFKKLNELKLDDCPNKLKSKNYKDYYHLIFFPTLREPLEIIDNAFKALCDAKYDIKKFIVVLSGEEIDAENYWHIARKIEEKYKDKFFRLIITMHKIMPGDLQGKGANMHWAGKHAKKLIDELGIDYEKIIVSNFDVDTCVHPQYYAYLTLKYLTNCDPLHRSYQPVTLYNNNIWESPFLIRIVHNSTTFWLLTELVRPERLVTFSSHSMSFQALVDVGFWHRDMVSEDSRITWQCIAKYDGNYSVEPMHISVSMDTVYSGKLWSSFKGQYKQHRRWAYGMENFPFIMMNIWNNKKISFSRRCSYAFRQLEGGFSWATAPIIIFLLGILPLHFANQEVKNTVLAQNAPIVLKYLMNSAMIGLVVSAILSAILLPPRPKKNSYWTYVIMLAQWIAFPFCMIIFGSIPATDAQTRLMIGKYMGFNVTEKGRKNRN